MNPNAINACIQLNLLRCPLLRMATVQDCLGKTRVEINAMIDCGELPFAFDLSAHPGTRPDPRVFALCVAEATGWKSPIGQTKNFQLPEVVGMILPKRDLRSVELKKIFNCSHQHVYELSGNFKVTRAPATTDGPNSYTVFARESVAGFLDKRRIA